MSQIEVTALGDESSSFVDLDDVRIKAHVEIAGCDAYTEFDIEGTETEISYLEEIARITQAVSEFSCEPTLTVTREKTRDDLSPDDPAWWAGLSVEEWGSL